MSLQFVKYQESSQISCILTNQLQKVITIYLVSQVTVYLYIARNVQKYG